MRKIMSILVILTMCVSCENAFEEVAKKDTDEAIFYEAKLKLNARDYNASIDLLTSLGPTFLAQRDVSLVYASAHSGRCGLEFVTLIDALTNLNTNNLFLFLMQTFLNGTDPKIADCLVSEGVLNGFGDHTQRIPDENILMGFSSLTKLGTILSRYADLDGDGVTDAGFDHCDASDLPDSAVREVGTGMANAILSITAVASDISSGTLDDISAYCNIDSNLQVFCTNTDPAGYSSLHVRALRQLIGSDDMGIGACGNFATVGCICP